MKIVKKYNQIINGSAALTQEQIDWCNKHIQLHQWDEQDGKVLLRGPKVFEYPEEITHFPVKFANTTTFNCSGLINLKSLDGSPDRVRCDLILNSCKSLKNLEGGPIRVEGNIIARNCGIESLKGIATGMGTNPLTRSTYSYDVITLINCTNLKSLDGLSHRFADYEINIDNAYYPKEKLIYAWRNDITVEDINNFEEDWEI